MCPISAHDTIVPQSSSLVPLTTHLTLTSGQPAVCLLSCCWASPFSPGTVVWTSQQRSSRYSRGTANSGRKPTDDKLLDEKSHGAKFGTETTVRFLVSRKFSEFVRTSEKYTSIDWFMQTKFRLHTNITLPFNVCVHDLNLTSKYGYYEKENSTYTSTFRRTMYVVHLKYHKIFLCSSTQAVPHPHFMCRCSDQY